MKRFLFPTNLLTNFQKIQLQHFYFKNVKKNHLQIGDFSCRIPTWKDFLSPGTSHFPQKTYILDKNNPQIYPKNCEIIKHDIFSDCYQLEKPIESVEIFIENNKNIDYTLLRVFQNLIINPCTDLTIFGCTIYPRYIFHPLMTSEKKNTIEQNLSSFCDFLYYRNYNPNLDFYNFQSLYEKNLKYYNIWKQDNLIFFEMHLTNEFNHRFEQPKVQNMQQKLNKKQIKI